MMRPTTIEAALHRIVLFGGMLLTSIRRLGLTRRFDRLLLPSWLASVLATHASAQDVVRMDAGLRQRAIQESTVPIRPGASGGQAFWNGHAVQSQFAPAFDFKEVPGAVSYRFTVVPARGETVAFTAEKPWAPLTHTQSHPKAPGRYPTWVMPNPGPMWFNGELLAIRAMLELAGTGPASAAPPKTRATPVDCWKAC